MICTVSVSELNGQTPPRDKDTDEIVGGIGVLCENRFGSEIEVGIGREWWFLLRLDLDGCQFPSDAQPPNHDFIFYLHGWHHTSFAAQEVMARDKCLRAIELWLEGHSLNSVTANIR